MAADVALYSQPANPCCAELKKRYVKLEEKRNALRQAVKLLEGQTNKLQDENDALKKVCEEECKRADLAQQAKEKESDIKNILEKEIWDLKSEIASLQESGTFRDQDRNQLLETRILQGEAEIQRVKELLQKEIKRGESEKKKVVEEKKKAAELWELVKIEKSKAEEEKRIADMERTKAEDMRHSLAKSKSEASEARKKLTEERLKTEAANNKVALEKQKVSREKKRADSERARVEDQRKLVEIERKKLMDEKNRADHLSRQLEEEGRKREELQKEMEEIVSNGQGLKSCLRSYKTKQVSSNNEDTQSANMKLLKNKLKLQRNQLKHAKRMAKLEKAEKQLLLQQLYLLKQDHIQFSRRLETLISCSSYGMEGTDGLAKVGGSLKRCATRPQRKFMCAEHDFNSQIETKSKCTTMEYMGSVIPCPWRLPQKCGGRSTKPISGISSDLESPVGDSVRDKSQNSAICSTAVTYSDTQLMGSQGRSAFAVATSAKLAKDNFQGSPSLNLTGEETKSLHVAQQNNDGSIFHRKLESPCTNSVVCNGVEVTRSDSRCNSGKRKARVILNAEDCSCCLKINNNNSVLDINSKSFASSLCRSDDVYSLHGGKNLATELSDDSDIRNYEFCMKKKSNRRQRLGLQPSDQIDSHNEVHGYLVDGHNETCFALPFLDATGHALACKNKSSDVVMNDQAALVCLIPEDYMKLLDLDDDGDEERYRAARARPLSPTLPELGSPSRRHSEDDYHNFTYGVFDGRCETEKEKLVSVIESNGRNYHSTSLSQDQLDSCLIPGKTNPGDTSEEINRALLLKSSSECSQFPLDGCVQVGSLSDTGALVNQTSHAIRTCHASGSDLIYPTKHKGAEPCDQVVSERMNLDNILEKKVAMDKENDLSVDKGAPQADIHWESRSSMKMETAKQISLSKAKELKCLNGDNGHEHWGVHGCCVVFSNTKDEQVISRILYTRNAIINDTSWGSEAGFSIAMVLHALATNLDISAEEKACVLFSLLLCKVSAMIPVNHAIDMVGDLSSESELVIAEVDRVISDEETRSIFLTTCLLDVFVSLIQDFLTARKVLICENTLCEQLYLCAYDNVYHLNNGNRTWSLRTAAINQLVAGSVILASISTVHDRVDILWQASFQLLRMCRGDSYWILTAVHVFASLCGVKFFSPTDHNLIVAAIKSLVLLLERGEESGGITSNGNKGPRFSRCTECPFTDGEACVDKVTSWLLDELQSCIACATRHSDSKKLVISSDNKLQACTSRADGHDAHNIQFDGSEESDTFCSLHTFVHQVDQNADTGFCHFTDIISLVELFGNYMGWEHLYSKIIQQLFTLLELCPSSAFSVSLLVLVGRLGRIGIETGGCDRRDVEGLMHSLSTFLEMDRTGKSGLPVQFAAVDALLNLLPLDFREIVKGPLNISLVTSQVVHVEHIRRWFHQLGEEQKAVSSRLFQNSDVKKS